MGDALRDAIWNERCAAENKAWRQHHKVGAEERRLLEPLSKPLSSSTPDLHAARLADRRTDRHTDRKAKGRQAHLAATWPSPEERPRSMQGRRGSQRRGSQRQGERRRSHLSVPHTGARRGSRRCSGAGAMAARTLKGLPAAWQPANLMTTRISPRPITPLGVPMPKAPASRAATPSQNAGPLTARGLMGAQERAEQCHLDATW